MSVTRPVPPASRPPGQVCAGCIRFAETPCRPQGYLCPNLRQAPKRRPGDDRGIHESRPRAFPVPQHRAFSRSPVHAHLRDGRGARALARMGARLRRAAQIRDARLLRVRGVLLSGRLARRQMEPRGHDGGVLHRHRPCGDRNGICPDAAAGRHRAFRDWRVRRDLPSGRPRDGDAEVEEHRHAPRREWRVGQSRRRERRADHRLPDRQRRLAHGLHPSGRCLDRGRHCVCAGAPRERSRPNARPRNPRRAMPPPPSITRDCCCACR